MRSLSILLFFLAIEAQSQPAGNNSCYFSPDSFLIPKTLTFVDSNDPEDVMIWEMRTIVSNGDTNLHTDIFRNYILTESIIEKIDKGNARMISYILYNGSSQAICTIVDSSIYEAGLTDFAKIRWKVVFADFNSSGKITITKIRQLSSATTTRQIFLDQVSTTSTERSDGFDYTMESVYEKGIGLVSLKLFLPGQKIRHFVLTKVQ